MLREREALIQDLFERVSGDSEISVEMQTPEQTQKEAERRLLLSMNREPSMHRPRVAHNPGNQKPIIDDEEKELSDEEYKKAKQKHCENNPYLADLTGECEKPEDKKPTQQPQGKRCDYKGQRYVIRNGNVFNAANGKQIKGQLAQDILNSQNCKTN